MKNYYLLIFYLFLFASCIKKSPTTNINISDTCVVKYNIKSEYKNPPSSLPEPIKRGGFLIHDIDYYVTIVYNSQDSNIIWNNALIYQATNAAFFSDEEDKRTIDINYQGKVNLYEYENPLDFYLIRLQYLHIDKTYRCFIDKKEGKIYYFDFEEHYLVKVNPNSDQVFLGGLCGKSCKSFDLRNLNPHFDMYLTTGNVCDSIAPNSEGITIVDCRGGGCLEVKNNKLDYQNIDLNNDGLLDIRFSGWRMQYCPEKNWDLASRTEQDTLIDSIPIIVDFIAYQNRAKQYRWRYVDRNCGMKLTTWD